MLTIRDPNKPNTLPYHIKYYKNIDLELSQKIYFQRRYVDRQGHIDIFNDEAFPNLKERVESGELKRNDRILIERLVVSRGKDLNVKEKERVLANSVKEICLTSDLVKEFVGVKLELVLKALLLDIYNTDNFSECLRNLILEHISIFNLDEKVNNINENIELANIKSSKEYYEKYLKVFEKL